MNTVADVVDWHQVLGPILGRALPLSELKPLAESVVRHPRRAVRLSPQSSIHELPFEVERVPWYDAGYFLNTTDVRPGEFLHAAAGDYYIQDAGSMLALAMCELTPGQKVCDTCASPGGKSTGALEQLGGSGLLVANEVIGSRLAILNLALSRTGYANHLMTNLEVDRLSDGLGANFDCVIVDAPCTGQSMVVRGKQSLAAYSAAQIEHSSARQKRIIRAAAKLVKPGGRLVYSTCTFSYAENELIVLDFLEEQPLWAPKRWEHLARWETPGFDGCYRLWPHRDQCAGAFAATLIRSPQAVLHEPGTAAIPRGRQVWNSLTGVPPQIDWLDEGWSSTGQWYLRGSHIHRFAESFPPAWVGMASSGMAIAEQRAGRFDPLYAAVVMRTSGFNVRRRIELDDRQAAQYVAGEAIRLPANASGWCAVMWAGRPLGWGKVAGGVLKNHYPKALRQVKHG